MTKRFWKIRGYDGNRKVFEQTVSAGSLSEPEMTALLKHLASRHLSEDEVVSASLRRNAKDYVGHLEIQRNTGRKYALMTTGSDRHYIAVIVDDH